MDKKREKKIEIRVSTKEKKIIQERAEKLNISTSKYARELLLNGDINLIKINDLEQLKRVGNNLNQIAKILHFSKSYNESELENTVNYLLHEIEKISSNNITLKVN